jgi:anti-anti-sigma factor
MRLTTAPREWQLEVTATARPSGISLRGEVDIFTLPTLELALEIIVGRAGDATVDLSELIFIDVIGLRALARAAIQLRSAGRFLRLTGAGMQTRRVLSLLGWAELFAFVTPAAQDTAASLSGLNTHSTLSMPSAEASTVHTANTAPSRDNRTAACPLMLADATSTPVQNRSAKAR